MVITPHFDDGGITTDPQQLCEDLADALAAWDIITTQLIVTAYDAQGAAPVYPQGRAIRNEGAVAATAVPREVALCLSFYSDRNLPRQRGRLYAPAGLFTSAVGLRPTVAMRDKLAVLAVDFQALGGPDVDWVVYSRADDVARPVTNWWIDDEWDTVRSRGLRATTRLMGTTSEA
jgi:hypothetical protein